MIKSMDADHALIMKPNDLLSFKFIPNVSTTSTIYLKNVSAGNIAYKVRTNAPKAYFVRLSQGILNPNEQKTLTVIMQPLEVIPNITQHKFLVQYAATSYAAGVKIGDFGKIWQEIKEDDVKSVKIAVGLECDAEKVEEISVEDVASVVTGGNEKESLSIKEEMFEKMWAPKKFVIAAVAAFMAFWLIRINI